jgi:glycosyl transferase family 25
MQRHESEFIQWLRLSVPRKLLVKIKEFNIDTYLINMDSAPHRMAHMQAELDRLGISFIRQVGVVGAELEQPHPDFSAWSYKYLHGRLWSPRELGCYLSHLECLKKFIKSDADYALILEDDVTLQDELESLISAALVHRRDWNMLRLSSVNHGKWWAVRCLNGDYNLSICLTREKGAGGYLVDRHAAEQMIKHLLPMRLAWDIAFDLEWFLGFKTLGIFPMPISQQSNFQTQIQQDLGQIKIKGILKYITVIPFRTVIEISRLGYRVMRLLKLKLI